MSRDVNGKIKGSEAGLKKAGEYLLSELRKTLSVQGTPDTPSKPGDPPKKQSGRLLRSLAIAFKQYVVEVGSNSPYGSILDGGSRWMRARPWFDATVERCRERMRQLVFGKK